MAKFLSIVISVFLLSACATVTEDNGSQVAATQELPTPGAEIQPSESNVPAPAEPARNEVAGKNSDQAGNQVDPSATEGGWI